MKNKKKLIAETAKQLGKETLSIPGNWPPERRCIVLPGWDKEETKVISDQYEIMHIHVTNKICVIYIYKAETSRHPIISLSALETMLDADLFFHAGQSHSVNMRFVKTYVWVGRCIVATLTNNKTVPVSYRQAKAFAAKAQGFSNIVPPENNK
jgi:hypothetical protein